MECRRCGAVLRKEGDFCPKCYKEVLEEEELKKDVVPLLTVKRKYKPGFHVRQRWDVIVITILTVLSCITAGHIFVGILSGIVGFAILLVYLAFQKMLAAKEKVVFYEKKVVKYSKVPFFGSTKEVAYKDIKDITYYQQTWRQKRANMGDIVVYVKYIGYFGGIKLDNVENGTEVIQEIIEKVPIRVEE